MAMNDYSTDGAGNGMKLFQLCQTTFVASAAADYLRFLFIHMWKIYRLNRNCEYTQHIGLADIPMQVITYKNSRSK